MRLSEIMKDIPCEIKGNADIEISDLKYDSRQVKQGDMFFCISGFEKDGHEYAADAVKNGASAIMVTKLQEGIGCTQVIVYSDRQAMALAAVNFFKNPAADMKTIGITGTNGKTTTTYMIKSIAEAAGMKVGLMGTIQNMIGDKALHTERTTPESVDLQRLLAEMRDEGCNLVVLEVSSHSLSLNRVEGMLFDVGIFTNLTQDHLDFHKTFEKYADAKKILFSQSKTSVINADDAYSEEMIAAAKNKVIRFGLSKRVEVHPESLDLTHMETRFTAEVLGNKIPIRVSIPGIFTVYNVLGAICAATALGIDSDSISAGLHDLQCVPGRFELLDTRGGEYSIILDYAHTPDSLENTLKTIRGFAKGRVVTLFGCGGNRDKGKRPQMARIAAAYSDFVIITSDNPRFEEPGEIIREIIEGLDNETKHYICIENRREAIQYAIENAQNKDIILLAGKGHETYQEIKGVKYDFDEKDVVAAILDENMQGVLEKELC